MRERPKYQQGKPIFDPLTHIDVIRKDVDLSHVYDSDILSMYKDTYRGWIRSTQNNTIKGLELFPHMQFSQGTTEAFDKFYIRHAKRRFRVFKGEYAYHKIMFKSGLDWEFLDDKPLASNDVVIISLPFSNTGGNYKYDDLLTQCEDLNIPVLVDCCWFGACGDLVFDLTYSCIQEVTFSLSKTFPVGRFRIGARFTKENYKEDGLIAYEYDSYINFHSMQIGLAYMKQFTPDFLFNKYRDRQLKLCKDLSVDASSVVNLATSSEAIWSYLDRGMPGIYRLCLTDELVDD